LAHNFTQYEKNINTCKCQGFNKNEHSEKNKYKNLEHVGSSISSVWSSRFASWHDSE